VDGKSARGAGCGTFTHHREGNMRYSRAFRLSAILALSATIAGLLAAAASGGQVFRETIHEEDSFVLEDFCDVSGLTVEVAFVIDIDVHVVSRGSDGLAYFLQHGTRTEVLTNLDAGTSLSSVANVVEKDQYITDNGDGTLTIVILATGNAVLYGEDGKAIARNPGQTRFEFLVDDGGTPTDPSDDEFLGGPEVVKESTGRSDDFCDAAVSALT
jgi:hypothetical protein